MKLASGKIDTPDERRQRTQAEAWKAYNGEFPKPLKISKTGNDDNIIVNRTRPIVDKGVSFLFGRPVTWQYSKKARKGALDYLKKAWQSNNQETFLRKLATVAGITGQAVVKLIQMQPYPRMVIWDASNLVVITAPDDCEYIIRYEYTYDSTDDEGQPCKRRQLIVRQETTWQIIDQIQVNGRQGLEWQQTGLAEWPFIFSPVVTCQNLPAPSQFWGQPDITPDLIQINRDLNYVLSQMSRIIRYHGFPRTVGKGFDSSTLKTAADGMVILPTTEASIAVLDSVSDLNGSIQLVRQLQGAMDELSRVPGIALGRMEDMPKGTISGIALKVLYSPLLEKTETKQGLYGELILEINRRLLLLDGQTELDDGMVTFPSPLPVNDLEDAQTASIWDGLGVSKRSVFTKCGLDPDLEADQIEEEDQAEATETPPYDPSGQPVQAGDIPMDENGGDSPAPASAGMPMMQPPAPDNKKRTIPARKKAA